MIAKTLFTAFLSVTLLSCSGQNASSEEYAAAEPVHILRFDKELFALINAGDTSLQQPLRQAYTGMLDVIGKGILNIQTPDDPGFFGALTRFYAEPTLKELYRDAIDRYDDVSDIEKELGKGFTWLRQNLPSIQQPVVCMHVSGFNQNVLVGDSLLSLSIDKYMGKDYPLYQDFFYDYQQQKMQRHNIAPDYLAGWIMSEYPFTGKENVLLDRMIYEGKIRYLLSQALPGMKAADLMGYTEDNLRWCEEHEADIWKGIIERKDLYTPDHLNTSRYFEDTPSAHLANEAPGTIGTWMGWQIVRKYMEETGSTPKALMGNADSQKILEAARYKP